MNQENIFKEKLEKDFSISHSIDENWVMNKFHFHDVFEIYYGMSNGVKYFVEDKVYEVKKGDLFVFNHMDLHKTIVPHGLRYERYVLTFNPAYIDDLSTPQTNLLECFLDRPSDFEHMVHLNHEQSEKLITLFNKAEKQFISGTYGSDIYPRLILTELLILVNSYFRLSYNSSSKNKTGTNARIKPVIEYIQNNLDNDLSLEKLSNTFYLSKYHLGVLFKKATGFSVTEYIIHRRIIKAKALLKNDLPVAQVCDEVGFNNLSHFIRTFKKIVGIPPKQYSLSTQFVDIPKGSSPVFIEDPDGSQV